MLTVLILPFTVGFISFYGELLQILRLQQAVALNFFSCSTKYPMCILRSLNNAIKNEYLAQIEPIKAWNACGRFEKALLSNLHTFTYIPINDYSFFFPKKFNIIYRFICLSIDEGKNVMKTTFGKKYQRKKLNNVKGN